MISTETVRSSIELRMGANGLQVSRRLDGEGNGTPLQYTCLENPMDGGAW